jgi:hypothetical protein
LNINGGIPFGPLQSYNKTTLSRVLSAQPSPYASLLPCSSHPTPFNQAPPVREWVRILNAATSGSQVVTAAVVAAANQNAYGSTALRFQAVRFIAVRAWALSLASTPVTLAIDFVSDSSNFTDSGGPGVENACISATFPLAIRTAVFPTTNTTTYATVTSASASMTIDVLVDFS